MNEFLREWVGGLDAFGRGLLTFAAIIAVVVMFICICTTFNTLAMAVLR
jgi:hypothetical protein